MYTGFKEPNSYPLLHIYTRGSSISEVTDNEMELWAAKLLTLLFLFTLTLVFGLIPVWLVSRLLSSRTGPRRVIISALNCVAGGVFLGTTFLHLLPEVQEIMATLLEDKGIDNNRYHVAECIICAGFFLIMFLEHLVMTVQHHHSDVSIESKDTASTGVDSDSEAEEKTEESEETTLGEAVITHQSGARHGHHGKYGSTASSSGDHLAGEHSGCNNLASAPPSSLQLDSQEEKAFESNTKNSGAEVPRSESVLPVVEEGGGSVHVISTTHHERHHMDGKQLQGIRSFVLLVALSLHTVFEGMALGLQSSSKDVWTLFTALALHKSVIAFTLGLQFVKNVAKLYRVILFIVIFSLMSPVGIAVGIVVSETSAGSGADWANAVLQGIATGTFIHVTFFEVLQKEVGQDHNILKVLAVVVGFVIIELTRIVGEA